MSAEKRSISAQRDLFASADARQKELGYSTFSDYVQALMRADVIAAGAHIRDAQTLKENPTPYGSSSAPVAAGVAAVIEHAGHVAKQPAVPARPPKPARQRKGKPAPASSKQ